MLILLVAVLLLQDQDAITLIRSLYNDDLEVRESAYKSLVKLGQKAVEELKKYENDADAEVQSRVQSILAEIKLNTDVAAVFKPNPSITFSSDKISAADLSTIITKLTGIKFSRLKSNKPFKVSWNDTPFMEALDDIGIQAGLMWIYEEDGSVDWPGRPFVAWPSVYFDGVRISVCRLEVLRTWNGIETAMGAWVVFNVHLDPGIKYITVPTIAVKEMKTNNQPFKKTFVDNVVRNTQDRCDFTSDRNTIEDIDPATTTLSIKGVLLIPVPLDRKVVEITKFDGPTTVDGFVITPISTVANFLNFTVEKPGEEEGLAKYIDTDSLVVESVNGPLKCTCDFTYYTPASGSLQIRLDATEVATPTKVKITINTSMTSKNFKFEFKDIKLP